MTGKLWYHLDMTAEHHAATVQHCKKCAPLGFCQMTAPHRQAGTHTNFSTLATHAKQQWLFVEPCMCEPLMVTLLGSTSHPHFKPLLAQGWALQ